VTSISGVSAISSSYSVQLQSTTRSQRPRDGQDPLASVAKALSLSTDDLKSKLKDGKTLSDVAEARGVSHDDLIAAIKAGRPSDAPASPEGVSDEKIASGQRPQGPPPGGGGPGGPGGPAGLRDSSKVQQLNTLLSSDDDLTKLSASQLVQKFQSKGVDLDQLRSVLNSGDLLDVKA
jgi:hypothetical protein